MKVYVVVEREQNRNGVVNSKVKVFYSLEEAEEYLRYRRAVFDYEFDVKYPKVLKHKGDAGANLNGWFIELDDNPNVCYTINITETEVI